MRLFVGLRAPDVTDRLSYLNLFVRYIVGGASKRGARVTLSQRLRGGAGAPHLSNSGWGFAHFAGGHVNKERNTA